MCRKLIYLTSFVLLLGLASNVSALLNYEYYEAPAGQQYNMLADVGFGVATPVRTGTANVNAGGGNWIESPDAGGHRASDYAFRFTGYILVPVTGSITFYLRSDDGSQLFINGTMVINNDGTHGTEGPPGDPGNITLTAGAHEIEVTQFERGGGESLWVNWSGPGLPLQAVPDSALYLEPPKRAMNPDPPDGAPAVTLPILSWSPGITAAFHDVYLGTNPTPGSAEYKGRQPLGWAMWFEMGGWTPGQTYYWRIDEVEADGTTIHVGDVWSFTAAPFTAYNPDPPDGARNMPTDVDLSWSPGATAVTHDIYFGTDETQVTDGTGGTFMGNQPEATYDPGTLAKDTRYYWRIDEVEQDNTTKHAGEVWNFKTIPDIPITDPDLMGWWKFDEGLGTTAIDWSGHNNHATLVGDPQWVEGYDGGALEFDGVGDYVNCGNPPDLQITDALSIMCWIKVNPWTKTWETIMAKGDNSYRLSRSGSGNATHMGISGTSASPTYFDATVVVTNNEWRHVAATYDGANARIYVDGVLDTTYPSTGQINNSTYSLYIGENSQATGRHITGLIDDVRVYKRALTVAEIAAAMRGDPTLAWNPNPANNSTPDIEHAEPITWTPGEKAAKHDVYFGTDRDAVEDADTTTTGVYRGRIDPNSYTPPEGVQVNETYYWRIDEYNTDATISEGRIWSFTVADYLIIDDFDDYDDYCNRIFYTWPDGWGHNGDLACGVPPYSGNGTGSTVGYLSEPYAEQTITHDGSFQSMPFEFLNDGSTGKQLYSETQREFQLPQDFTRRGMRSLSLWFQGLPGSVGSFSYDAVTDIYTMTGDGQDIWNTQQPAGSGNWVEHDEFHYAYKQLSGVGSIQAQVLSVDNTNTWAKAGVMIRETLDVNSVHTMTVITPGQGVSFQRRPVTGQASEHNTQGGIQAPQWVRISRSGNDFTAEYSADGNTWQTLGTPQNIPMASNVYIGLALTSHNTDPTVACTATFSNVTTTGSVTGQWQSQDIGIASNDAEQLYVALEDSTGTVKDVPHPDPNAVQLDTWQEWNIDLADFAPVDVTKVKKIYIGVGNRNTPALGGGGMLYIDDIRLYAPRCIPSLVKPAADFSNNCIVDYPDLEILADNWLRVVWDTTGGHDGGSLTFGPTDDYVAIEDLSYNSTGLTAVSVSAWIRTDSDATQYIASFDRNEYWRLEINGSGAGPGQVGWDVMTDTGQVDYGSAARVDDGLWHHVVGVFDNGTLTIYIDGIAESPATGGATFGTGDTRFGFLGANSEATVFDGARGGGNPVQQLDDFRIYDYALSAADVTGLAQGTADPATGPVLWYKLDETSGSIAADSSGNGYDGHLVFSWFDMNLHDDTTLDFKDYAILADTFLDEILWP